MKKQLKRNVIQKHAKLISVMVWAGLMPNQLAANTIGNDFQKFNPNANGIDYVTVESSSTTKPGKIRTGLILDYSTNVLPVIDEPETTQSITSVADSLINAHITASYGVIKNLEVGLHLPMILSQSTSEVDSFKGEIVSSGLTYLGASTKYKAWSNSIYGVAVGGNVGFDLMSSNPYIGDTTPFYFSTYAAMDAKYDTMKFAVNLGYKFRSTGEAIEDENYFNPPIEPASHEFFFSGGLNFPISKQGEITTELYGSMLLGDFTDSSDRESYSAEILASYKHELRSGISLNGGLGTELMHGVGSADLRLFAGISYEFNGPKISTSSSRSQRTQRSQKADDDIYGIPPSSDEPAYDPYDYSPSSEPANKKQENKIDESIYNIEETELPSFDDPQDYSLD